MTICELSVALIPWICFDRPVQLILRTYNSSIFFSLIHFLLQKSIWKDSESTLGSCSLLLIAASQLIISLLTNSGRFQKVIEFKMLNQFLSLVVKLKQNPTQYTFSCVCACKGQISVIQKTCNVLLLKLHFTDRYQHLLTVRDEFPVTIQCHVNQNRH